MIQKLKKHSVLFGMIISIAAALTTIAMTWVAFIDQQAYARMQDVLFDCGVDAIGACVSAGLFFGCMKQEGEGTKAFRCLNIFVSLSFVVNFLLYYTMGVPEQNIATFIFVMLSKLFDLVMIYFFYQYMRSTLVFEGKLARWTEKGIPILLGLEALVILSNIFYPLTFYIDEAGLYFATDISVLEDIYLIVASLITTILIIRSKRPLNQKIAGLTFILLPLFGYAMVGGEFGNASQYGMILVSLIIMYCIIFNEKSSKLTVCLSGELNTLTAPKLSELLDRELGGADDLTVDFKECDYVSSAGLRVLLGTFKQMRANGGEMRLVNVGEGFMEVLENTGLDSVFDVETC